MTRMGRDANVRHPQKRVHRDSVNLQAIALVQLDGRDDALQGSMRHPGSIKAEGRGPDRARHVKESPSRSGEFLSDLATVEMAGHGAPTTRVCFSLEAQRLGQQRAFLDQYVAWG